MRMLDLFSGIGGFALAAQWCWGDELEIVSFVEIDKFCQKVLRKHWSDVPIVEDVRDVKKEKIQRIVSNSRCIQRPPFWGEQSASESEVSIDLLTGGFPCQPFSCAGKRKGKEDNRFLWPEMFRIIKEFRPRWVVAENVAGIVRMELDNCISDLEGEGYTTQAVIIPACAVNAPHRRDRVWIVAYAKGRKDIRRERGIMASQKECWEGIHPSIEFGCQDVGNSQGTRFPSCFMGQEQKQFRRTNIRTGEWWSTEPDVGRVAHEFSTKLDGGRLNGEVDDSEKVTEELYITWQALREMWVNREFTKTPPILQGRKLPDSLLKMPYRNGPTSWNSPEEKDKELSDLWERVSSIPFQEAQHLLPELLERIRQNQCNEKMAWWNTEPNIPRVAHGVKGRVDRLKSLGNAIVPSVALQIFKAIKEIDPQVPDRISG